MIQMNSLALQMDMPVCAGMANFAAEILYHEWQ